MAQPDQELIDGLRQEAAEYKRVDDQLRELNRQIYPLRAERKLVEDRIVDIVRRPDFARFTVLAMPDGSSIKVRQPQTWNAPWSLSKNKLRNYLTQYFSDPNRIKSAEVCYQFIHDAHQASLRQNTYAIERMVPNAE